MFRIDTATATPTEPVPKAVGTPGYFEDGNPATGTAATQLDADWFNMVQEELVSVLTAAGIAPSKTTQNQVLTAIFTLIAGGYLSATRIRLTANLDLYVNESSGSDTTGAGTSGNPWATLAHAWSTIVNNYDLGGFVVTVHAQGALTAGLSAVGSLGGNGTVVIDGGAHGIAVANGSCFLANNGAAYTVQNFSATSATGTAAGQGTIIGAGNQGQITLGASMHIGIGALYDFNAQYGGQLFLNSAYTVSTGAHVIHFRWSNGGQIYANGIAITLSATPSCSSEWANGENCGSAQISACTFSGTGSGPAGLIEMNAALDTSGTTGFPGNGAFTQNLGGEKR